MNTVVTLQPQYRHNGAGEIPRPWHIDLPSGNVRRQDIFKGDPKQLVGFTSDPAVFEVELMRGEFAEEPARAQGMYPIFVTSGGQLWTSNHRVDVQVHSNPAEALPEPVPAGAHASSQD